ncbi:unnamed protein product [Pylaiella littoralis]
MNVVMMKASRLGSSSWAGAKLQQQHLIKKAVFSAPATAAAQQQELQQYQSDASRLRVAVSPRVSWKDPAAAGAAGAAGTAGAVNVTQEQAVHRVMASGVAPEANINHHRDYWPQVSTTSTTSKFDHHHMDVMQQEVVQAPPGDLRLVDFMEQVKLELWQYNDMPLRKRFRVQSLLRRLQTPPLETWSGALARATEESSRTFTRTLLARHDASSSCMYVPADNETDAPGFDLLLLCWRPGGASVIHDHPKAGCWVKMLTGELKETRYSLVPSDSSSSSSSAENAVNTCTTTTTTTTIENDSSAVGGFAVGDDTVIGSEDERKAAAAGGGERLVETSAVSCTPGAVTYMEDSMGFHKMENLSLTEECISLHLYSPGISECTTWADASCAGNSVKAQVFLDDDFEGRGGGAYRGTEKNGGRQRGEVVYVRFLLCHGAILGAACSSTGVSQGARKGVNMPERKGGHTAYVPPS